MLMTFGCDDSATLCLARVCPPNAIYAFGGEHEYVLPKVYAKRSKEKRLGT